MTALAEQVHNPSLPIGYDFAGFGVTAVVLTVIVAAFVVVIRHIARGRSERDS
jgi:hypothetical protein